MGNFITKIRQERSCILDSLPYLAKAGRGTEWESSFRFRRGIIPSAGLEQDYLTAAERVGRWNQRFKEVHAGKLVPLDGTY